MTNEELLFWTHNWFSQYPENVSEVQREAMLQLISDNAEAFTGFVKGFRGEIVEAKQAELTNSLAAAETELTEIGKL